MLHPVGEPVVFPSKFPLERPMRIILDGSVDLAVVGDARYPPRSGEAHQILQVVFVDSNASSPAEVVVVVALATRPLDRAVDAREPVLLPSEYAIDVTAKKPLDPLAIKEPFVGKASTQSNSGPVGFSIRLAATIGDVMVEGNLNNAEGVGKDLIASGGDVL
jgi:hypothetical protein